MLQALRYDGPALLQVYAPSPTRHGFASEQTIAQAALAVRSRAMPLFRYSPSGDGVFGSRISLDDNPDVTALLAANDDGNQPLSAADWAFGQKRFSAHFKILAEDAAAPLPLHEWLQLDAASRSKKTPYLADGRGEQQQRYSMTAAMSEMATQCAETWQTLQELAGIITPFTQRLEQQIRAEVAAEHQAQLDAQTEDANARILELQKKTEAEIAGKIRSRLLDLASRKRS
jgi:pyruvate-ferredoxin/flavodoxin oxidoreductase